jgi:hypothetical protein
VRFRTAAILSALLVGGILFLLPAVIEASFLPSLRQGVPNHVPGYEQILLAVALFCHDRRWLLAPLTVLVLFLIAASSSESGVHRQSGALPGARQSVEKFIASGIYLLMGTSAGYIFSVGLANGIASGYHYPIRQKLLIGAALTGAATLLLSAILVHFRSVAAYGIATVATLLLWLAFWPLIAIINQGGPDDFFAVLLLPVATIFSLLRLLKLVRS